MLFCPMHRVLEPLLDHKEWENVKDKKQYLEE